MEEKEKIKLKNNCENLISNILFQLRTFDIISTKDRDEIEEFIRQKLWKKNEM